MPRPHKHVWLIWLDQLTNSTSAPRVRTSMLLASERGNQNCRKGIRRINNSVIPEFQNCLELAEKGGVLSNYG